MLVLGGSLAATPSYATASSASSAAPVGKTAVAKVKASPAKQSGTCPTTVGFSAVVTANRWQAGPGQDQDPQTLSRRAAGTQAPSVDPAFLGSEDAALLLRAGGRLRDLHAQPPGIRVEEELAELPPLLRREPNRPHRRQHEDVAVRKGDQIKW
jgi:hypothetical protein